MGQLVKYQIAIHFNALEPRYYDRLFANNIFIFSFLHENRCVLLQISLGFVPKGAIDDTSAPVRAWWLTSVAPLCTSLIIWFCSNTCLVGLLIRSIFRGKNCTSFSARVQFFERKIERINRPTRAVLLQSRNCFIYEQQHREKCW